MTSKYKSITITPEEFKNGNYETFFYNELYFAMVGRSKAFVLFLCF